MSEDCLFLNIWGPRRESKLEKLPVFVYIHGGSFIVGAGSNDVVLPTTFTTKNALLVSLNYRLGLFGFWRHKELTAVSPDAPTNFGLFDQIAALEWVNKNIGYFGGDRNSVTVFGESAGGMSILNLLSSKRMQDKSKPKLFHRAAISNAVIINHKFLNMEEAEMIGDELANDVGCKTPGKVYECMRDIKDEKLVVYSSSRWSAFDREMNKELLLPAFDLNFPSVLEALKKDHFDKDVPIIIGTALNEGTLFSWFTFPIYGPEKDFLELIINKSFPGFGTEILKKYRNMSFDNEWDLYSEIFGDVTWQCPNNIVADILSEKSNQPIRKYMFGYQPKFSQQAFKVFHSIELGFVFRHASGSYLWPANFTEEEAAFASQISDYWIDFGKGQLNESVWPLYNTANRHYLQFGLLDDIDIKLNNSLKEDICKFWKSSFPTGPQEFPDQLMSHEGFISKSLNEFFWFMTRHLWLFRIETLVAFGIMIIACIALLLKKSSQNKPVNPIKKNQ